MFPGRGNEKDEEKGGITFPPFFFQTKLKFLFVGGKSKPDRPSGLRLRTHLAKGSAGRGSI